MQRLAESLGGVAHRILHLVGRLRALTSRRQNSAQHHGVAAIGLHGVFIKVQVGGGVGLSGAHAVDHPQTGNLGRHLKLYRATLPFGGGRNHVNHIVVQHHRRNHRMGRRLGLRGREERGIHQDVSAHAPDAFHQYARRQFLHHAQRIAGHALARQRAGVGVVARLPVQAVAGQHAAAQVQVAGGHQHQVALQRAILGDGPVSKYFGVEAVVLAEQGQRRSQRHQLCRGAGGEDLLLVDGHQCLLLRLVVDHHSVVGIAQQGPFQHLADALLERVLFFGLYGRCLGRLRGALFIG